MKIFDLLWWLFDIGNEPTSPDVQHKTNEPPVPTPPTPEPCQGLIGEGDMDQAEFDEFCQ